MRDPPEPLKQNSARGQQTSSHAATPVGFAGLPPSRETADQRMPEGVAFSPWINSGNGKGFDPTRGGKGQSQRHQGDTIQQMQVVRWHAGPEGAQREFDVGMSEVEQARFGVEALRVRDPTSSRAPNTEPRVGTAEGIMVEAPYRSAPLIALQPPSASELESPRIDAREPRIPPLPKFAASKQPPNIKLVVDGVERSGTLGSDGRVTLDGPEVFAIGSDDEASTLPRFGETSLVNPFSPIAASPSRKSLRKATFLRG